MLLILVISYRHIKQKNLELEVKENEIYFAELEKQRQKIYDKMYKDHQTKEIEINEYLRLQEGNPNALQLFPNQIFVNEIDGLKKAAMNDHHDDSTDDEFFEMPLPPIPSSPTEKCSLDGNENVSPTSLLTAKIEETPKVENTSSIFNFSQPFKAAPPTQSDLDSSPITPRQSSDPMASNESSTASSPQKVMLQSDL